MQKAEDDIMINGNSSLGKDGKNYLEVVTKIFVSL